MVTCASDFPSGYRIEPSGLYLDGEPISNFIVCPTALYCRQGDNLPFACDLEISQEKGVQRRKHVPLKQLTEAWWRVPPSGCYYNPFAKHPHKKLQALFQHFYSLLSPQAVILAAEIGWLSLPSGRTVYVTGSEIIGSHPDEETIWLPDQLEEFVIEREPGVSTEDALGYFWKLFTLMPGITDVLLVYTLASFLSPMFSAAGIIPRFPLILEGPTEAKKTTLACLACGVFSRISNPRACVVGLTSTKCALELRAGQMRHCTLIVDDLFPDGGRSQQEKALNLIRDLANQDVREVRSGNTLTGSRMDCGVVITAEFFPVCNRSTRTRCLRLKLQDPVPNSMLRPFQTRPSLLGTVFKEFLRRVSAQYDGFCTMIESDFHSYRAQRGRPDAPATRSERLAEIGFYLSEALDVLLAVFPRADRDDVMREFQERLNCWLDWQLSPEAAPDLRDMTAVIPELSREYPDFFFCHRGCLCVSPDDLCGLLRHRFGDQTIDRDFIIRLLRERNALQMDKSGAATKKIAGRRYLCLLPHRL